MPPKFGISNGYFQLINNETGDVVMEGTIDDFNLNEIKIQEEGNKMEKFNLEKHWNDFIKGKIIVNCKTKELSDEFLTFCKSKEFKWYPEGEPMSKEHLWNNYKENTFYGGSNKILWYNDCSQNYYSPTYAIVEFNGFMQDDTYNHIKQTKPPLGVMPKQIFEWYRVIELCKALHEYSLYEDVDQHLMIKWSDELNDRLYGLKGERD